jgi:hypothetical protein
MIVPARGMLVPLNGMIVPQGGITNGTINLSQKRGTRLLLRDASFHDFDMDEHTRAIDATLNLMTLFLSFVLNYFLLLTFQLVDFKRDDVT